MSYSQLVLSENPYGYWEFSDALPTIDLQAFDFNNITYEDQFSNEYDTGTFLGTSVDNTVYVDTYYDTYGLNITEYQNNEIYTDTYGSYYGSWSFEIQDLTNRENNGIVFGSPGLGYKPIVPSCIRSVKFNSTDTMEVPNIYNLFSYGKEGGTFSLELFFSIDSSSTTSPHHIIYLADILSCYVLSDKVFLSSNDQVVSIPVESWDKSIYVSISYENRTLKLNVNNSNPEYIQLPSTFYFPTTQIDNIQLGPSSDAGPMFVNSLALYSYVISNDQINRRLSWSEYLPSLKDISVTDTFSTFDLSYTSNISQNKILVTSEETLNASVIDNLEISGDSLRLSYLDRPTMFGDNYSLSSSGLKVFANTYLNASNASQNLRNANFTIRMQAVATGVVDNTTYQNIYYNLYDQVSTEETLVEFGPLDNYLSCRVYKTESNTVALSLTNIDGSESILLESATITDFNSYNDIAISVNNNLVTLVVNGVGQDYTSAPFPSILDNSFIYIGNSSDLLTPYTNYIKNFSIDQYTETTDLDFSAIGRYTLKLNNNLNVSQYGQWFYSYTPVDYAISSYITYNTASSAQVYVNDQQINSSDVVPGYDYSSLDPITFYIYLETDNATDDIQIFNDLYLVIYTDMTIASNDGQYVISPLQSSASVSTEPFTLSTQSVGQLSKPSNLGIKFVNGQTSGASLDKYSDSDIDGIYFIDFILKLDSIPTTQTYTIVDTESSIAKTLSINSSGLNISGDIDVYVDGVAASNGFSLNDKDFYHIAINFKEEIFSTIYLGSANDSSDNMSGSVGELAVSSSSPIDISTYLTNKTQALIGRIKLICSDSDPISITDYSSIQSIIRTQDGKYFEMTYLPKIKIIESRWKSIVMTE